MAVTRMTCTVFLREIVVFMMIVFVMIYEVKSRGLAGGDETDK